MTLAAAIAARDADLLPSRRDEDWRWTDLRGLIRAIPALSEGFVPTPGGPFSNLTDFELAFGNGAFKQDDGAIKNGSFVGLMEGEEETVAVRFCSDASGTAHACRMIFGLLPNSKLTVLESYEGKGDYLAAVDLDFQIEDGASVHRIVFVDEPGDAVLVSNANVAVGVGASFQQTILTTGGRRQRMETFLGSRGEGATVRLDAAYVLSAKRHADITTVVQHNGPNGATTQLTKGVATDQARGVFQGRIVVQRGADGTDARMAHHALLLSDRAEIDAKPELEIYADDVSCAHGNTVGALSDEALFYARARGIPEAEARVMLTSAFLGEVVERIEHVAAREAAHAWLARRLEQLV